MYQITKLRARKGDPSSAVITVEDEHYVVKLLGWYPAGPLKDDGERGLDEGERARRVREHDLVKFVARNGGVRVVRAADLQVL